jgi:hypothetical protein
MNNIHECPEIIPSKKLMLRHVGPHFEAFVRIIRDAFGMYDGISPTLRLDFDATARANDRYCLIARNAERAFQSILGVRVARKGRVLFLVVNERFRLRFKKLDNRLRPSAYPTGQYALFMSQTQELPGLEMTNLIVGYRLDQFGMLSGIYIVCPMGAQNLWSHELHDTFAAQRPLPLIEEIPVRSRITEEQKKKAL